METKLVVAIVVVAEAVVQQANFNAVAELAAVAVMGTKLVVAIVVVAEAVVVAVEICL